MAPQYVEKMAQVLGFTEDDAFLRVVPLYPEFTVLPEDLAFPERLRPVEIACRDWMDLPDLDALGKDEVVAACTLFAARHLSKAVEAFLLLPQTDLFSPWHQALLLYINSDPGYPYLALFVRTHEEQALDLLRRSLSLVASAVPSPNSSLDDDNVANTTNWLALCGFSHVLTGLTSLPTRPGPKPSWLEPHPSLISKMDQISERIEKMKDERPVDHSVKVQGWYVPALASFFRSVILDQQVRYQERFRLGFPWFACGAKPDRREKESTPCRVLADGEEMMMCSRCRTVRYCSHAHQKAHWKLHKLTCIAPEWE